MKWTLFILLFTIFTTDNSRAQVLTPPYFNLAVGRKIEATATCGVGVPDPELFCKLTGANPDKDDEIGDFEVIQGQMCDHCDPKDPGRNHASENAIDGTEKWWQSPPLSRGPQYNEVNITIDLGQEFHVAYIFIKMGNSPRPGAFVLERSKDFGKTWQPWQYFASSLSECHSLFTQYGFSASITRDDSVICTSEYSPVIPLEGGEIVVSLVNNRPSANNFSYSESLQQWTKATNIRLKLLKTNTLYGHYMALTKQDVTVTRRYYYSIKDISIGGQCVCNGHANICDLTDVRYPSKLICRCQHNTCGEQCDRCCPGFIQKKWRPATLDAINECEPCNCHGHSTECRYDEDVAMNRTSLDVHGRTEGGGVCLNCQHNTEGINCERCKSGFYRPSGVPKDAPNACRKCSCDSKYSSGSCDEGTGKCQCRHEFAGPDCKKCNDGYYGYPNCVPCRCHVNGTQNQLCDAGLGQCPCKPNFDGPNCDQCALGFYNFPECKACDCDDYGAREKRCDARTGQCICHPRYGGRNCGHCANGYFNYPMCDTCNCDRAGSSDEICDKRDGSCLCKEDFAGQMCDKCRAGYYRFPHCISCECNELGVYVNDCNLNGQCFCKQNFIGRKCDQCAPGYYNYPQCMTCNCDPYGSSGSECDPVTGQCFCHPTFEGITCDRCRANYYNFPHCEECSCNPAGAKEVPGFPLGGCGSHHGGQLCECKERVTGKFCDICKPNFWKLSINNPDGCENCGCDTRGTVGNSITCDPGTGQCRCKPFVTGRLCNTCIDGTYNLQEYNTFGCQACKCDVGGSQDMTCDKKTGQCNCKPRITGKKCEGPISTHYFPTLFHNFYELEDGRTPEGGLVRYGFDQNTFPSFSWRGYAIFSEIQEEVLMNVDVKKSSMYRIIYRYINPENAPVVAEVVVSSDASSGEMPPQKSTVTFQPTRSAEFTTVSSGGGVMSTFVLNAGRSTVSLKTPKNVYVDYMVLLPDAYYEATVLQDKFLPPCTIPASNEICKHYVYVTLNSFTHTRGANGYYGIGQNRIPTQIYSDYTVLEKLGVADMAKLDDRQTSLDVEVPVPRPGKYVFVVSYFTSDVNRVQEVEVELYNYDDKMNGVLRLPNCPYSSPCRQFVALQDHDVLHFDVTGDYVTLKFYGRSDLDMGLESVYAIPIEQWNLGLIAPQYKCIYVDGKCMKTHTPAIPPGKRVDFEIGEGVIENPPEIVDPSSKVIKLDAVAPRIDLRITLTSPGKYAIVPLYYQPYVSGFDVRVDVYSGGYVSKGTLRADHCPSTSGCYGVVKFDETPFIDLSDLDIRLTFNSSQPVWLDYLVIVPSVSFDNNIVDDNIGVDKSKDFINICASNNFNIDPETSNFCKGGVYSLVTDYNNGALRCDCNADGSLSFNCEAFGGNCPCKQNVIGRTCSQCRIGYWGFPNCRECQCPLGICEPITGKCICPPKVTGDNCDRCQPQTYGFNPQIGCSDCNCEPIGVQDGNLVCNELSGQCSCKQNIIGRKCDRCLYGYYGFPNCEECRCDHRGVVLPEICEDNSQCICKRNVEGSSCGQCKANTFFLEERNPNGCSQCFCFGITARCRESSLRWSQINEMIGWRASNLEEAAEIQEDSSSVGYNYFNVVHKEQAVYWMAPHYYIGNKVTSYGGRLSYGIYFETEPSAKSLIKSDVVLESEEFKISHVLNELPTAGSNYRAAVDFLENEFFHEATGAKVSREQFMMVLSDLKSLRIRATYYHPTNRFQLFDVSMDVATPVGNGPAAANVEQCECPPNYAGTSCESCATGFYRSQDGPYMGTCIPCMCNNRADRCDQITGVCLSCRDNFDGPQCSTCRQGYYLDLYSGTCKICSCPHPDERNNFATSCDVSADGRVERCHCLPGYDGRNCERCAFGFYGDPNAPGGVCRECHCTGNVDASVYMPCDPSTGVCLNCLYNTGGDRCERCKEGYYGDAIFLKDCKMCRCDPLGTETCDHRTGECMCKPNVRGPTCNECVEAAFGFESGRGCEMCDCGVASLNNLCDSHSGQCQCRPGVVGRKCDQCQEGFWNYSPRGCQECECLSKGAVTCDKITGRCQCLPGVTGPNCDRCMSKWIMIQGVGCRECDNCIHLLLDDLESLDGNVTIMKRDLETVSVSLQTIKRLEAINRTVIELRPKIQDILTIDGSSQDIISLKEQIRKVRKASDEVAVNVDRVIRRASITEDDARNARNEAHKLHDDIVKNALHDANEAILLVKGILDTITGSGLGPNVNDYLTRSEIMLKEIKEKNLITEESDARKELDLATEALNRAKELINGADSQMNKTSNVSLHIEQILSKFLDIQNYTKVSTDQSNSAISIINEINRRKIEFKNDVDKIKTLFGQVKSCFDESEKLISQANKHLQDARSAFINMEHELKILQEKGQEADQFQRNLKEENTRLDVLVANAMEHANRLSLQSQDLLTLIGNTQISSDRAIRAASAYENITRSMNEALNASFWAVSVAEEAVILSRGLSNKTQESQERSNKLAEEIHKLDRKIEEELKVKLMRLGDLLKEIKEIVITEELNELITGLENLPSSGFASKAQEASAVATSAQAAIEEAENKVKRIQKLLPDQKKRISDLPGEVTRVNNDLMDAQNNIDKVLLLKPEAANVISQLTFQSERLIELENNLRLTLTALKEQIQVARDTANMIRVGVNFTRESSLQVRNIKEMSSAGISSEVSLFFKTSQRDGLIYYIGPEMESSEYMVLELLDGYLYSRMSNGPGEGIIKTANTYNDDKWHQVIVKRNGNDMTMTVRGEKQADEVVKGSMKGPQFVMNFDGNTKFFIGGIPDHAKAKLGRVLKTSNFVGGIEEVRFDKHFIGLWNFVHAKDIRGHNLRQGLLVTEEYPRSFTFGGNGYVILKSNRPPNDVTTDVLFYIKTYESDGLLFFIGGAKGFISLELKDGKLHFQYNLGSGLAFATSEKALNDGMVHKIYFKRHRSLSILKVDDAAVQGRVKSGGTRIFLDPYDKIYIGGYKGDHNVSGVISKSYKGCLFDLELWSTKISLYDNLEAKDVYPGCTSMSSLVSFGTYTSEESYVSYSKEFDIHSDFGLKFKFRTNQTDALIFYMTGADQSETMSMSVVDGGMKLIFVSRNGKEVISTPVDVKFNDGHWHYVSILTTKLPPYHITFNIDDKFVEEKEIKADGSATVTLYIGGVPKSILMSDNNVGSKEQFTGCIGDISFHTSLISFEGLDSATKVGVSPSVCHYPDFVQPQLPPPDTSKPPLIPPTKKPQVCALPLHPFVDGQEKGGGMRFGMTSDSRLEYARIPLLNNEKSNYTLEFKTSKGSGVLYYVSDAKHKDFIGIYLKDGNIKIAFNCGGGIARLTSSMKYNDNMWTKIVFSRYQKDGILIINDDQETHRATSDGSPKSIEVVAPHYVGGLPEEVGLAAAKNMENVRDQFIGCIKSIAHENAEFGREDKNVGVSECKTQFEDGSFFYSDKATITLDDQFKVPSNFELVFEMKPRVLEAVLLSIYNSTTGDYLALQLLNGEVLFSMENGLKTEPFSRFIPPSKNQLCNGEWHKVKATKAKNVILLEIDGVSANPGIGREGFFQTDTQDELYFGGLPENAINNPGLKTKKSYVGCIRNLMIDGKVITLKDPAMVKGMVDTEKCPVT